MGVVLDLADRAGTAAAVRQAAEALGGLDILVNNAGIYPLAQLAQLLRSKPEIKDVHFWGKFPGEPIESANERLQYISDHVLPKVKADLT